MSIINRLANTYEAAKKAWLDPVNDVKETKPTAQAAQPSATPYYFDTMAAAEEQFELPPIVSINNNNNFPTTVLSQGKVETRLDELSAIINEEMAKSNPDYNKLQSLVYKVIILTMRLAAKSESEQIREFSFKIKTQAQEIKATYNTWQGLTVTLISAGISVAGGMAGMSQFLPLSVISAQNAQGLLQASQSIGTAGQGVQSVAGIFNNRSDGIRTVEQDVQRQLQGKEEEHKGFKQTKNGLIDSAKRAAEDFDRNDHQAKSAATAA